MRFKLGFVLSSLFDMSARAHTHHVASHQHTRQGQYETTLLSDLTPLVEVDVAAGGGPVDLRAEASIVVDRAVPAGTSLAVALPLVWGDGSDAVCFFVGWAAQLGWKRTTGVSRFIGSRCGVVAAAWCLCYTVVGEKTLCC